MKEALDILEAVGGALAHTVRLRILALLREGDLFVCQIRTVLALAPSTVSVHLAILRRAGLVTEQKKGRFVQYGLTDEGPLASVVRELLHLIKADRQVDDDGRLLEAVRRTPLDRLCRPGLVTGCHRGRAMRVPRRTRPRPKAGAPAG